MREAHTLRVELDDSRPGGLLEPCRTSARSPCAAVSVLTVGRSEGGDE